MGDRVRLKNKSAVNLRHFAIASCVPIAMMLIAMYAKPLWRDEYWSLYFADRSHTLEYLFPNRMADEVHPPFYYIALYYWQVIFGHPFYLKGLSLFAFLLTAFGLYHITDPQNRRRLILFLLISAGSYWVIYFATEIRHYVLSYCFAAITVALTPKLVGPERPSAWACFTWVVAAALLALTHYYGALWVACLGFVIGLNWLAGRNFNRFIFIGILTVIALIPVCLWLGYSFSHINLADETASRPVIDKLFDGLHQFLRGLFVKTFGSNPLITLMGFGGLIAAFRKGGKPSMRVLLWAVILTVLIVFTMQLLIVDLIKERGFIVIMPAILFIFADHISDGEFRWARFLPWMTAIMPFLFVSEYFKNKERLGEFRSHFVDHAQQCKDAKILAYFRPLTYRPTSQPEFYPYGTEQVLNFKSNGIQFSPDIVDIRDAPDGTVGTCPIKAVAVFMPKRNDALKAEAWTLLKQHGFDDNDLEELSFGKGRNLMWIEKQSGE